MGMEQDALFGDLANAGEAEHLESARIGEDGARPGHEFVQSAELPDQLVPWAQIEMISVAEQDPGVELRAQIALREALDGGLRPHRHEDRRLDVTMRRMQHAGPCAGDRTL